MLHIHSFVSVRRMIICSPQKKNVPNWGSSWRYYWLIYKLDWKTINGRSVLLPWRAVMQLHMNTRWWSQSREWDHPRRIPIPFWRSLSLDPELWLYWSCNLWKPAGTSVKWPESRPWKRHFPPSPDVPPAVWGTVVQTRTKNAAQTSQRSGISMDDRINNGWLHMLLLGQVNV